MGHLRERMIEDMELNDFSHHTRKSYLTYVADFTRCHRCSPDPLGLEHIQQYQLHLTRERKVKYGTFKIATCALRYFFKVTLKKGFYINEIPIRRPDIACLRF